MRLGEPSRSGRPAPVLVSYPEGGSGDDVPVTARKKAYRWRLQSYRFTITEPGTYFLTFDGRWSLHRVGSPKAGRVREGDSPLPTATTPATASPARSARTTPTDP